MWACCSPHTEPVGSASYFPQHGVIEQEAGLAFSAAPHDDDAASQQPAEHAQQSQPGGQSSPQSQHEQGQHSAAGLAATLAPLTTPHTSVTPHDVPASQQPAGHEQQVHPGGQASPQSQYEQGQHAAAGVASEVRFTPAMLNPVAATNPAITLNNMTHLR